jgi:hypothetical protein
MINDFHPCPDRCSNIRHAIDSACARQAESGDLPGSEVKETNAELTFVSFSYKRNGFASFATKRRIITYLTWIILSFIRGVLINR